MRLNTARMFNKAKNRRDRSRRRMSYKDPGVGSSCFPTSPPPRHSAQPIANSFSAPPHRPQMVHPMALSSLFPTSRPQKAPATPLPPYERLLDVCATQASHPSIDVTSQDAWKRDCPLLALHTSLTDLQTYFSNPLRPVQPTTGHEPQWESGMRDVTRAYNSHLRRGVQEVRLSGMQGEDVKALVEHAEGVVDRHHVKLNAVMEGDDSIGFLLL